MANMQCQLWMGSLEPNMTESFIMSAFQRAGQRPLTVKVMRNKYSGEPAGYAFVHFQTDDEAMDAMHKLNGKPIPGTFPVVRFRLNTASRESKSAVQHEREYSVWVGDLSPDVDDYSLYRVFSAKYNSIKTAKVIIDSSGYTKGYGFVRFGSEDEQRNALYAMNGYVGLGTKPLKICTAVPKPKSAAPNSSSSGGSNAGYEYGHQYYDPAQYWQQQQQQQQQQQGYSGWPNYYSGNAPSGGSDAPSSAATQLLSLVEHARPLDVEALNAEQLAASRCLWSALEESQWLPPRLAAL